HWSETASATPRGQRAGRCGARRPRRSRGAYAAAALRVAVRRRDGNRWRTLLPVAAAAPRMIRFEDVAVRYPRAARRALDGVALEAPRGRLTAVVGPNGSGKSTLVRALLGRVEIGAGRILIDDRPLAHEQRTQIAKRIAVV